MTDPIDDKDEMEYSELDYSDLINYVPNYVEIPVISERQWNEYIQSFQRSEIPDKN